jgi:acyl CoA:acetate/3-ketoacid CoA transferase beta subunit
MVLRERAPGVTVEAVCAATSATLIIPAEVPEMALQA